MIVFGLLTLVGGIATGYMLGYWFPVADQYGFTACDCALFKRELLMLHAKHAQCPKPKGLTP